MVEESKIQKIKKHLLKWQKVYLFVISLVLLLASNFNIDNLKKYFFTEVYLVLDNSKRESVVWIVCFTICGFYFYYERHLKSPFRKGVLKVSNVFLDFVSSFYTFSSVINASLNLLSKILKEFIGKEKTFVNGNIYDFYFIIACSILPIIWVITQMFEYVVSIFKIETQELTPNVVLNNSVIEDGHNRNITSTS